MKTRKELLAEITRLERLLAVYKQTSQLQGMKYRRYRKMYDDLYEKVNPAPVNFHRSITCDKNTLDFLESL